jgi:hypothetical protein
MNAQPVRAASSPSPRRRRVTAFVALVLAVVLVHFAVTDRVAQSLHELGAAASEPVRLQAAFVREIQQAAPPAEAPRPAAPPRPKRPRTAVAKPRAPAASAPQEIASAPEPAASAEQGIASAPELEASAPQEVAAASESASPAQPEASASAPSPAASASGAPPFEWPPSTQLRYSLLGWYRGEVRGSAQVQWIREGSHYQVHLDVVVGPGFAPLLQRRMTSDGELGEQGLIPRRYDEITKPPLGATRRAGVIFEGNEAALNDGRRVDVRPGVQDTASQFVQLSYLFSVDPQRLQVGKSVELPLALPRRYDLWVYDVIGRETLSAPFGEVETYHLRPRREADPSTLAFEAWFAPSLRFLPVRILIRQDEQTFIDLMIDRPPLEALPATSPASPSPKETR